MPDGLKEVRMINKPNLADVPPFYRGYVEPLPENGIEAYLKEQCSSFVSWMKELPKAAYQETYGKDKWTVAEVIGHLIDAERVFSFRIMSIARGEQGALPGFDQNAYVVEGRFNQRDSESLIEEFTALRAANLALINSLDDTAAHKEGNANEVNMSISTIVYIMAGHVRHHMHIFKEKYGL